jgi:virginiamycin B lyase
VRPFDITVGPDGALWFTEQSESVIGRITTAGTISQFPIAGLSNPGTDSITTDGAGNLWASNNGQIVRAVLNIVPGGTPTFTVFNAGSGGPIVGMTKGPNGNVYLTDEDAPGIGWINL